jgi:hypothetical protein
MFAQKDGEHHDRHEEECGAGGDGGQSWPLTPMMVGMKGGAVWALPDVNSTAKAYSFQAKIRQKIAVEAMPVAACGSTTL